LLRSFLLKHVIVIFFTYTVYIRHPSSVATLAACYSEGGATVAPYERHRPEVIRNVMSLCRELPGWISCAAGRTVE